MLNDYITSEKGMTQHKVDEKQMLVYDPDRIYIVIKPK